MFVQATGLLGVSPIVLYFGRGSVLRICSRLCPFCHVERGRDISHFPRARSISRNYGEVRDFSTSREMTQGHSLLQILSLELTRNQSGLIATRKLPPEHCRSYCSLRARWRYSCRVAT